jgi:hypothetical protein
VATDLEEDLRLFVLFRFPKKTKILGLTTKNFDVFYGYCLVEIVNVLVRISSLISSKFGNKKQSDTQ